MSLTYTIERNSTLKEKTVINNKFSQIKEKNVSLFTYHPAIRRKTVAGTGNRYRLVHSFASVHTGNLPCQ